MAVEITDTIGDFGLCTLDIVVRQVLRMSVRSISCEDKLRQPSGRKNVTHDEWKMSVMPYGS
jgi:hypothetical protein